jgi:hypothetical protein
MVSEPEVFVVTAPALFSDFRERLTHGQRRRHVLERLKFLVKWVLNWKGTRNA